MSRAVYLILKSRFEFICGVFRPAGIPELGVRPIDPLYVDGFNFSEVSGKFRVNLEMTNVTMDGLGEYLVTGVRSNLQELSLEIRLRVPSLNFRAHYHMDGRFLFLALSGGGTCQYNFTDVDNKVVVNGHLVRRVSDDALHFRVASLRWTMLPSRGRSRFFAPEGDTSMRSRATSNLLNEYADDDWESFQRAAERAFTEVFRERINRLMMNIPYRDLFPPGVLPLHLLELPIADSEEDEYPPLHWTRPSTTTTTTSTTTTAPPPTTTSTTTTTTTAPPPTTTSTTTTTTTAPPPTTTSTTTTAPPPSTVLVSTTPASVSYGVEEAPSAAGRVIVNAGGEENGGEYVVKESGMVDAVTRGEATSQGNEEAHSEGGTARGGGSAAGGKDGGVVTQDPRDVVVTYDVTPEAPAGHTVPVQDDTSPLEETGGVSVEVVALSEDSDSKNSQTVRVEEKDGDLFVGVELAAAPGGRPEDYGERNPTASSTGDTAGVKPGEVGAEETSPAPEAIPEGENGAVNAGDEVAKQGETTLTLKENSTGGAQEGGAAVHRDDDEEDAVEPEGARIASYDTDFTLDNERVDATSPTPHSPPPSSPVSVYIGDLPPDSRAEYVVVSFADQPESTSGDLLEVAARTDEVSPVQSDLGQVGETEGTTGSSGVGTVGDNKVDQGALESTTTDGHTDAIEAPDSHPTEGMAAPVSTADGLDQATEADNLIPSGSEEEEEDDGALLAEPPLIRDERGLLQADSKPTPTPEVSGNATDEASGFSLAVLGQAVSEIAKELFAEVSEVFAADGVQNATVT
ncbi:hypothetical protein ONE63_006872 [Megalurothrips usitatus]|uniref:Uncharacterized protein n=1 Tax=Megalurothrips usitatus TaxID=439358 RepID=A0AAV7XUG8_9NEOP|nr:hypothetical protein ONE63_006872 [Megalurothrips usitatus]